MATCIFTTSPGVAVAIADPNITTVNFGFTNWLGYANENAILQGISITSQGNYQFTCTLRNFIYVYVFGEKVGDIVITGLTFAGNCTAIAFGGMTSVVAYYNANCISATGMPIGVGLGMDSFSAFLVGCNISMVNPETQVGQFSLVLKSIPG